MKLSAKEIELTWGQRIDKTARELSLLSHPHKMHCIKESDPFRMHVLSCNLENSV